MNLTLHLGYKGHMKTIISGGIASPILGLFSYAFAGIRPVMSDIAAVLGIIVSIATLILISANVRKSNRESEKFKHDEERAKAQFEVWVMSQCRNCEQPDNCVFKTEHKPAKCKWKDET